MTDPLREADSPTKDGLPRKAFAYAPTADPSTWKLPFLTASGAPDPDHLPGAAAALSAGGFRGEKADIPEQAIGVVKAKLRGAYRRWGKSPDEMPESIREALTIVESEWDRSLAEQWGEAPIRLTEADYAAMDEALAERMPVLA